MTENDLAAIKEELSETGYVRRKTVRKKIKLKTNRCTIFQAMVFICM